MRGLSTEFQGKFYPAHILKHSLYLLLMPADKSMNLKDLFLRVLFLALTTMVMVLINKNPGADLHLKLRRPQPFSKKIVILKVNDTYKIPELINELDRHEPRAILCPQSLVDMQTKRLWTYSTTRDENRGHQLHFQFLADSDGQLRKVSMVDHTDSDLFSGIEKDKVYLINYRGPKKSIEPIVNFDLRRLKDEDLKGKIFIISSGKSPSHITPVGPLSEVEVIANIIDNSLENRFVPQIPIFNQIILLIFILIASIALLIYLPSTLALVATTLFTIIYISLSLWLFDQFTILTPIVTPLVQIILTYLLISNYKFVLNESTKWSLERESSYLKELEEMKTNFLSLFSHDLKTPLSKIIGITENLLSKTQDEDQKQELEKIKSYSKDLDRYIKKILKMSQLQSNKVSLNISSEDINSVIEKSVNQISLYAREKGVQLQTELTPMFMTEMDGSLIQEVIINFLENAVNHSQTGDLIKIRSQEDGEFIRVSVVDQGPGIPKEVQDSIWEKYYQFDPQKSGYGLGLFLSRYVVNLHGGKVFLKSKEKQGSEFGFLLPMNEEKHEPKN